MSKPFTILGFPKADRSVGSSRYRFWYLADEWEAAGATVIAKNESAVNALSWAALRAEIASADVVYLQRPLYHRSAFFKLMSALFTTRTLVVFDYDDAVYRNAFLKWLLLLSRADVVIAGSEQLQVHARRFGKRAELIPTTVPASIYFAEDTPEFRKQSPLRIGWVGNGPSHVENLSLLAEPFRLLQQRGVDFTFSLVGSLGDPRIHALFAFLGNRYIETPSLNWSDPQELVRMMRDWDIGVMPLADTEWNRGKCAFKAIEYMAVGLPAVVSAVGENTKLVEGTLSWLSVTTPEEWAHAFQKLLDPALRTQTGAACRERIQQTYTTERVAPLYLKLFGFDQHALDL